MKYFKITHSTTLDDLKTQYRDLAKIHHPDKGGEPSVMQEINTEYEEELKKLKKREYRKGNYKAADNIDDHIDEIDGYINTIMKTISEMVPGGKLVEKLAYNVMKVGEFAVNRHTNYRNKLKGLK